MDLVLEVAEHPVGGFSLDLFGYDVATGAPVIVENQLEPSDHTHLGQIITYAAGTDPRTVVWIATRFRSEHRAAIDWLNERTDEYTRFFGVEIHVVQINDSIPAPSFELVAEPNDWEKEVKSAVRFKGSDSPRAGTYRAFWEQALEAIRIEDPSWTRARTTAQAWCNTPIGTSGVVISMAWVGGELVTQVYFESTDADLNANRFGALLVRKDEFEEALGAQCEWDAMPGRKGARIVTRSGLTDVDDRAQWPQAIEWLIQCQRRMRAAIFAAGGVN